MAKKRTLSMAMEPQFDFQPEGPDQKKQHQPQSVLGSNFVKIYPLGNIEGHPEVVDFELLDLDHVWAMGPSTRFVVQGKFEVSKPPPDGQMPEWGDCTEEELDKVVVQPNWFESMFQLDFFHGNTLLTYSSEIPGVVSFLNAWKYNYMDKIQKKKLCPDDASPGFGVPSKVGGWDMNEPTSEWRTGYGPKIFCGRNIKFDFVPMNVPPMFQGNNYLEEAQKSWPMPILDKLLFRMTFKKDLDHIFKNSGTNQSKYRFFFQDIYLVVEKLKLLPSVFNTLTTKKGVIRYPGVTRISKMDNVPHESFSYKAKIQGVQFPEGMFIFAVPKAVVDGNYKYSSNVDGNVFAKHNIKEVQFTFGGHSFFLDTISIGKIQSDIIEKKLFYDYMTAPPFGMTMDPDKITLANIQDGGKDTPYPHVYVNFCNYGNKTRIQPVAFPIHPNDERELEVNLIFGPGGSTREVTYIIYYFYTDNNLILNLPKQTSNVFFSSPYLIQRA
jgi:hypothetical protein